MLPTKKYLLTLVLSFCCLSLRCASSNRLESANINQDEIHQTYSIRREKDSLNITAIFRLKDKYGDTLALNAPSHVTCNDKEMQRRDVVFSGVTYTADSKTYQPTNQFTFTDTQGKTYTNTIALEPIEFAVESVQLKKAAVNLIPVTRIVKDDSADIKLFITDGKGTDFYEQVHHGRGVVGLRNSIYFDEKKRAVVIEPDFVKEIAEGEATVFLLMRKDKGLEQATSYGGQINLEYKGDPLKATITAK